MGQQEAREGAVMTRNFGSPRCIGAETTPGAPSPRVAVSREPIWLAGLEADLMSEVSPSSSGLTAASPSRSARSRPLGARNEDASIQLAGYSSRPANSRGESSEPFIRECATAFFVAAFASFPVVTVWFLCAVIDWEGVWETTSRLFDLG